MFTGGRRYYSWLAFLTLLIVMGGFAYYRQTVHGLGVSGMTDQVSWGLYIANFTFLVGMAAAAVMLVIPVYVYKNRELHDLVIFGEPFDEARHEIRYAVKAVTYHDLSIRREPGRWIARIIFDI